MRTRQTAIVIVVFLIAARLHALLAAFDWYGALWSWSPEALSVLRNGVQLAVVLGTVVLLYRVSLREAVGELGLTAPAGRALLAAFIATAPLPLTFALAFPFDFQVSIAALAAYGIVAPFAEEVLFRAFLFGHLVRRAGWSFWSAALAVAAIFGAGHAYQAATGRLSLAGLAGVVAITAAGSIFFSWLFVRWGFNLWIAFGVHALMNLWWSLFAVDSTALGGWIANGARVAVVAVAIVVTRTRWAKVAPFPRTA